MNKTKFFSSMLAVALFATSGVLTSCKDYNDDIKDLQSKIDVTALKTDLEGLKTSLQTELSSVQSSLDTKTAALQTAINGKADAATVQTLSDNVQNLTAKATALETQIAAISTSLADYAKTSDLEKMAATYATLTGDLSKLEEIVAAKATQSDIDAAVAQETAARIAAEQNLQLQIEALKAMETALNQLKEKVTNLENSGYDDTEVKAGIAALQQKLADYDAQTATVAELKRSMQAFSEDINDFNSNIDVLNVLVNKMLNSISLVPDLYVGGIEAIEFKSLQYKEVKAGTSGLQYTGSMILVDNGTAEATYRLNPSTVKRETIDEDNMEYFAAQAETRGVVANSPVAFNGVKSFENGLMTVFLKKTTTESLKLADNKIWIVALSVPRKADAESGQEAANIVSENSRLVETTFWPQIARLNGACVEDLYETRLDKTNTPVGIYHYSDSTTVWQSKVDATPLQMVYEEVVYNETFDVRKYVTGCYNKDNNAATDHHEITKDALKTYGLTFRFAIPTKEYKEDADHRTDQQQFASIDAVTGIVSSKLPNGVIDNKACVGKEPIIRIDLVDTVRNKLVDQRYLKIKWVEKKLEDVELDPYTSETTLKPCDDNNAGGIPWVKFINDVYAKAAIGGLSQSSFEAIYPVANVTYGPVSVNPGNSTPNPLLAGISAPTTPVVAATTNENGDAIIANWILTPDQIARIYPSQSKTFTCTITFNSSMPTEYPNLKLTWSWTINLPALPEINGYYDNYWFTKYSLHDVMPVQYNTAAYFSELDAQNVREGGLTPYRKADNNVAPGTPYCVYYNNLMNAFTYEQDNNGNPTFIVKGIANTCGTWDMQFTKAGSDQFAGILNNNKSYTQETGFAPIFNGNSPLLNRGAAWNTDAAYRLYDITTTPATQALQMVWDDGHAAWCGNPAHYQAILYADHNNPANQKLINPLSDLNEADGRTPQRTHEKKVHVGIWATLNDWNIIPVKDYDICLVAPLRINDNLGKYGFEEGYVSGTAVECASAFTMTDFRGYTVAQTNGTDEWTKYATELWKYYEVEAPVWDLANVRYGMEKVDGNIKANDALGYSTSLTAAQLNAATNGNIVLSITMQSVGGKDYLVFKNNGGSNVEEKVNVFIPVSVKYGFGTVTNYCKVRLFPKGKVDEPVVIKPF